MRWPHGVLTAAVLPLLLAACAGSSGSVTGGTGSVTGGTGSPTTGSTPATGSASSATPTSPPTGAAPPTSIDPRTDVIRPSDAPPKPPATMPPVPPTAGVDPALQSYVDLAKADLAARVQLPVGGTIDVLTAMVVTWPDASLGCPKPGMAYAQVLVDGSLIVLRAGDKDYAYHAGGSTKPFLCEN
jgi:hypothetical protein